MKRILIVLPSFQHGGTIRSARSFCERFGNGKYEIDIFCLQKMGEFENYFKRHNILSESIELSVSLSLRDSLKRYNLIKKIKAVFYYIKNKYILKKNLDEVFENVAKKKFKNNEYLSVLAFQEGLATSFAQYISCNNKIAWVRCDYSRYYDMVKKDENSTYLNYRKIICVSKYTAKVFKEYVQSASDRVVSIYNFIDSNGIIKDSKVPIDDERFENGKFNIVSIGRMDPVKQFCEIPNVVKKLVDYYENFKWYIIGDGGLEKDKLQEIIKKFNLENNIILMGAKNNPYPYIKSSNLLVCLSMSEACPNVINEAKILHIPILSNSFPTVYEFIESEKNGIICEIADMHKYIEKLILDRKYYEKISKEVSNFVYDNESIIKAIDEIIKGE